MSIFNNNNNILKYKWGNLAMKVHTEFLGPARAKSPVSHLVRPGSVRRLPRIGIRSNSTCFWMMSPPTLLFSYFHLRTALCTKKTQIFGIATPTTTQIFELLHVNLDSKFLVWRFIPSNKSRNWQNGNIYISG